MKTDAFTDEAVKIWKRMSNDKVSVDDQLIRELDFTKKLLFFSRLGETFYSIFNFQQIKFDFVSADVEPLLGYSPGEYTVELFMENLHPEDRPWFLNCQEEVGKFVLELPVEKQMKYKFRCDYRMRKKSGDYFRIMHQSIVAQSDDAGKILKTLVIITDISHIKPDGRPVLSYIGMDGAPSFHDVRVLDMFSSTDLVITKREREVLFHLVEGRSSKEIAELLCLSKHTIDSHRKKLLQKLGAVNVGELVAKAIKDGWV
jgi:DNA-binding CsgD family transcriptional regulator